MFPALRSLQNFAGTGKMPAAYFKRFYPDKEGKIFMFSLTVPGELLELFPFFSVKPGKHA